MNTYIALIFLIAPSFSYPWTFDSSFSNFIENQTQSMNNFFQEQRKKMETLITSSYDDAMKMKTSVNEYVEDKQKKISNEINTYVETMKKSGRKVTDNFSFTPTEVTKIEELDNPDVVLSVPAIISRHGYICETHTIISQGYVLNVHRIPKSKNSNTISEKTVLLHHGLFASSADWIMNGPDKGLAYVLSEAGYDVWMANIRGNKYSKEHLHFKTDSKAYWNFSWHDVALHDVPAVIDYIRKVKDNAQIAYIGHSMGTTILFAMLSLRPEYNDILTAGFALAPVVFMSEIKSPIKALSPIASNVAYMEMMYGSHEFLPKNSVLGKVASSCDVDKIDGKVCKNVVFSLCGYNENQFNKTLLPVFLAHLGTGTSWKTVVHFAQEMEAGGKFQMFDYGGFYNKKQYGTETPPEYDLSKIKLPIKLFWASNDLLSSEKDVMTLYGKLPSETTELYKIADPNFNHIDYLWAIDAPTLLNKQLLFTLEKTFHKTGFTFNIKFK